MSDNEAPRQESIPIWQAPLLGAGVLSSLGILEWLARRPESPLEVGGLALASVVVVHGLLGGAGGFAAQLWSRTRGSLAGIAAFALVLLLPAVVYFTGNGLRGAALGLLAAAAAFPLLRRALSALPLTTNRVGVAHGLVLSAAVVVVALQSLEARVPMAPLVVAALALVGFVHRHASWPNLAGFAALAVLVAGGLPTPEFKSTPADDAPSVLLVTLDTLRADRLGFDGFAQAQTPTLDALASDGVWFANAQALSSWTGPSHLTILTGRSPASHGVLLNGRRLPSSVPTLGELLSAGGWHTGAFVAGFPVQARSLGIRDAFHTYDDRFEPAALEAFGSTLTHGFRQWRRGNARRHWRRSATEVNAAVLPWLGQSRTRPFFAWVHYFDPHLPYEQGEIEGPDKGWDYGLSLLEKQAIVSSPERLARIRAHYDLQITYTDRHLGEVVERAREAARGNLWIVVTADHGESFGEHDFFFNRDAYEVTGRVPLIVVPPRNDESLRRGRRDRVVGSHDIAPTLLGLLGQPIPPEMEGTDLLAERADPDRAIIKLHEPEEPGKYQRAVSVRRDGYRLIQREAGWHGRKLAHGGTELYDLASDPGEIHDLAGTGHPQEAALSARLPREARENGPEKVLDGETREALKALGYLD